MACGLPVAAYPVTGPLDVIGDSRAGMMHEDLRTACLAALELKREDAMAHAQKFSWRAATEEFVAHAHPRERSARLQGRLVDSSEAA
jgi:glycosyltransferase involved in cell wall biosynthesis